MKTIEDIMNAPCLFCGYKGSGYYQKGTHKRHCHWHLIGGLSERIEYFKKAITEKRIKIVTNYIDVDEFYKE